MTIQSAMVSSETFEWPTPQYVFDSLNREFQFTLDVSANKKNAKCKKFFSLEKDGLLQDWSRDVCYMNPPFNRQTKKWIEKAVQEAKAGAIVVCLISAGTGRAYWHELIFPNAAQIRFVKGFLKYGDSNVGAPFASAVVVFDFKNQYKEKFLYNITFK